MSAKNPGLENWTTAAASSKILSMLPQLSLASPPHSLHVVLACRSPVVLEAALRWQAAVWHGLPWP